jgi:[protein-PII] uridylyltransferase
MSEKYLIVTSPQHIAKHLMMTQSRLSEPVVILTEQKHTIGYTNITICVEGIRGVFSTIAGVLSRNRLNILGAQIYTSSDGIAVDTLQVETMDSASVHDPTIWQRLETDLKTALADKQHLDSVLTRRGTTTDERKLQSFAQPSNVVIDNTISDFYTVIEIQTQDRIGLLYSLTQLLFDRGLDIALAKISTEANKAIDVFYVTDDAGNKLHDNNYCIRVKQALLEALE